MLNLEKSNMPVIFRFVLGIYVIRLRSIFSLSAIFFRVFSISLKSAVICTSNLTTRVGI